jgi:hypothetical protein
MADEFEVCWTQTDATAAAKAATRLVDPSERLVRRHRALGEQNTAVMEALSSWLRRASAR